MFTLMQPKGAQGLRRVVTLDEICADCGFSANQVRWFVRRGSLRRRYGRTVYGFDLDDVNRFLLDLNNGRLPVSDLEQARRAKLRAQRAAKKKVQPKSPGIRVERHARRGLERAG